MMRWRHGLPGVLFWTIFCLSNGGRSFTKNMHRKSAFSMGISNSNLACAIIGLQRTRKAKKKKKSKFRLSSTLKKLAKVFQPMSKTKFNRAMYARFFPRFKVTARNVIGSSRCLPLLWSAGVIALVLFYRQSFESRSINDTIAGLGCYLGCVVESIPTPHSGPHFYGF